VRRISEVKDENCYIKLFRLLIKENVKYMRNRNGIFFNVGLLSDDVLTKIDNILIVNEMIKKNITIIYRNGY
jgi:hypothetical protein